MYKTQKKIEKYKNGMTVLEVLLAIVIMSIVSVVIWRAVLAGDVLFGRNVLIENATQLAYNIAESLKAQAPDAEMIEDREFETSVGSRRFVVRQKVIEAAEIDTLISTYPVKAVALEVYEGYDEGGDVKGEPVVSFKYIQGYNIK